MLPFSGERYGPGLANVNAVDESRNRHEAGSDVVIDPVIAEVHSFALQLQSLGRPRIVVAVAHIARTEGILIRLAVQVQGTRGAQR